MLCIDFDDETQLYKYELRFKDGLLDGAFKIIPATAFYKETFEIKTDGTFVGTYSVLLGSYCDENSATGTYTTSSDTITFITEGLDGEGHPYDPFTLTADRDGNLVFTDVEEGRTIVYERVYQ